MRILWRRKGRNLNYRAVGRTVRVFVLLSFVVYCRACLGKWRGPFQKELVYAFRFISLPNGSFQILRDAQALHRHWSPAVWIWMFLRRPSFREVQACVASAKLRAESREGWFSDKLAMSEFFLPRFLRLLNEAGSQPEIKNEFWYVFEIRSWLFISTVL